MRILLTGSSGWLGRFLAPKLLAAGHQVTGLDVAAGSCTDVVGTVADPELVDRVFRDHNVEAVIHAGALHKPDIIRYPAQAFVDVNVTGTLNLLEAAAKAGHDRFVFTSTTSLMISEEVRAGKSGGADKAFWLDEDFGPLKPRNIYGITKLAAENLCRLYSKLHGMDVAILRTSRFFPEDDDTLAHPGGLNLKANEFLNRRLAVEDAVEAHICALANITGRGCETFIVSAPPPFDPSEGRELMHDAQAVIARKFPQTVDLYNERGWVLPDIIERVYDPSKMERLLGFRCKTDFAAILSALAAGEQLPFQHDPSYFSPKEKSGALC